jgi:hypothetical protein
MASQRLGEVGRGFHSLSLCLLIVTPLVSAAGSVSAADKIALTCTGKFASHKTNFKDEPTNDHAVLIDLGQGRVSGSLGHFSISNVSELWIEFSTPPGGPRPSEGLLNRISGKLTLTAHRGNGDIDYVYALDCKRASPVL